MERIREYAVGLSAAVKRFFEALGKTIAYSIGIFLNLLYILAFIGWYGLKALSKELYNFIRATFRLIFDIVRWPIETLVVPILETIFEETESFADIVKERAEIAVGCLLGLVLLCITSSVYIYPNISFHLPNIPDAPDIKSISLDIDNKIITFSETELKGPPIENGLIRLVLIAVTALLSAGLGLVIYFLVYGILGGDSFDSETQGFFAFIFGGTLIIAGLILWLYVTYRIEPNSSSIVVWGQAISKLPSFFIRLVIILAFGSILISVWDWITNRAPNASIGVIYLILFTLVWFFFTLKLSLAPSIF